MKSFWPARRTLSEARRREAARERRREASIGPAGTGGERQTGDAQMEEVFQPGWLRRSLGIYLAVIGASLIIAFLIG